MEWAAWREYGHNLSPHSSVKIAYFPYGELMRGQLSAEMLILIVVVLAVVAIAATQLMGSAKETSKNIQNQSDRINLMTAEAIKSAEGEYCMYDEDCREGLSCQDYRCTS